MAIIELRHAKWIAIENHSLKLNQETCNTSNQKEEQKKKRDCNTPCLYGTPLKEYLHQLERGEQIIVKGIWYVLKKVPNGTFARQSGLDIKA